MLSGQRIQKTEGSCPWREAFTEKMEFNLGPENWGKLSKWRVSRAQRHRVGVFAVREPEVASMKADQIIAMRDSSPALSW